MKLGILLTSSLAVGGEYIELTKLVSNKLAEQKIGIVYGGTEYGMMKELAVGYKNAGGPDLTGVMSRELESVTKNYKVFDGLDSIFWENKIVERTRKISDISDGFIILPGGYGALEEMTSIIGGKVNKLHNKPIVLFNYNNFYDKFLLFLEEMHARSFSKISFADVVYVCDDLDDALNYFKTYSSNIIPDKFV